MYNTKCFITKKEQKYWTETICWLWALLSSLDSIDLLFRWIWHYFKWKCSTACETTDKWYPLNNWKHCCLLHGWINDINSCKYIPTFVSCLHFWGSWSLQLAHSPWQVLAMENVTLSPTLSSLFGLLFSIISAMASCPKILKLKRLTK